MKPIFVGWTRSFWLTVMGLLTILEAGTPVLRGVVYLIAPIFDLDPEHTLEWVITVAPAILWLAALHQRKGNNRPYSINPKDI